MSTFSFILICLFSIFLLLVECQFQQVANPDYDYAEWVGDENDSGEAAKDPCQIEKNYFDQKVDHSDDGASRNDGIWQQMYLVQWCNFDFDDQNNSPVVFLQIGGESPANPEPLSNRQFPIMQMAKQNGAVIVQLEHRFFGRNETANAGLGNNTVANLRQLLTAEQALEDIAAFIPFFNAKHLNGSISARWVAFGCSYPGVLAAWLRAKYSHLTVGAVAGSAPIEAKLNFWEWGQKIEEDIRDINEQCYEQIRIGINELDEWQWTEEGMQKIFEIYGYNHDEVVGRIFERWSDLIDECKSIKKMEQVCSDFVAAVMKDGKNQTLARHKALKAMIDERGCELFPAAGYKSMNIIRTSHNEWRWMTCNQFGYFMTTEKEDSIFGSTKTLRSYFQRCANTFGTDIDAKYVETAVERTRAEYGDGCTFESTNLLFTINGYDPLGTLSIREECRGEKQRQLDKQIGLNYITTPKAFHCADFKPYAEGEAEGLKETRTKTEEIVKGFLTNDL